MQFDAQKPSQVEEHRFTAGSCAGWHFACRFISEDEERVDRSASPQRPSGFGIQDRIWRTLAFQLRATPINQPLINQKWSLPPVCPGTTFLQRKSAAPLQGGQKWS